MKLNRRKAIAAAIAVACAPNLRVLVNDVLPTITLPPNLSPGTKVTINWGDGTTVSGEVYSFRAGRVRS